MISPGMVLSSTTWDHALVLITGGGQGARSWANLCEKHGGCPETYAFDTVRNGDRVLVFKAHHGLPSTDPHREIAPGVFLVRPGAGLFLVDGGHPDLSSIPTAAPMPGWLVEAWERGAFGAIATPDVIGVGMILDPINPGPKAEARSREKAEAAEKLWRAIATEAVAEVARLRSELEAAIARPQPAATPDARTPQ